MTLYFLVYKFEFNEKKEIKEDYIPKCMCKEPGDVRPNILFYNDS